MRSTANISPIGRFAVGMMLGLMVLGMPISEAVAQHAGAFARVGFGARGIAMGNAQASDVFSGAISEETEAPTTTVLNLGTNDSISTVGLGEVTFGMTVAQAQVAAGTDLINCAPTSDCYRVTPAQGPEGISFLVTESTIERVDIVAGPLTTRSGIGIGSPEDDIINLFGDQIETQVNDDSSVDLIFVPQDESDAEFRVIFTIRDGVVETFRSGRIPQVTVQNPCAG